MSVPERVAAERAYLQGDEASSPTTLWVPEWTALEWAAMLMIKLGQLAECAHPGNGNDEQSRAIVPILIAISSMAQDAVESLEAQ